MFNTELSSEVSVSLDSKIIRIFDTSFYYKDEEVENYLLEVLPVNRNKWATFYVKKGFSLVLNSSNLGYRKVTDSVELSILPDGIYEFKQSYKPNIKTIAHFYHLRTTDLLRQIHSKRDLLLSKECKLSRLEYNQNRDKIRDIEEFAIAAKWKVEECGDKEKGIELYEWALKLLQQYGKECQCS